VRRDASAFDSISVKSGNIPATTPRQLFPNDSQSSNDNSRATDQRIAFRRFQDSSENQTERRAPGAQAKQRRRVVLVAPQHGTKSERVPIGLYDPSAPPKSLTATPRGYSFAAAVRAAETLALEHHAHKPFGGRPALEEAKHEAEAAAAALAEKNGRYTLENLLDHYADHLEKLERSSHADVRSIFKLHVKGPWPEVAKLPAKEVDGEQIGDMTRRVADAGKGRTANKLRSYVRAAYQTARASRSKASIPVHFKNYEITHNPAMDTEPDESQNRAKKHPLLEDDMCRYWQAICSMTDFKGAVLRLHLLTGGQRIEQLVRLRTEHIGTDEILLFDGKGRPGKGVRDNPVPLVPAARDALTLCKSNGAYAISTDGGETHLSSSTLSEWARDAAAGAGIKDFQTKRIRSGVETLLAKAGISVEIRGRLQSHGISGVQTRHYDGHDYMEEQRAALKTLHTGLTSGSEKPKASRKTSCS
jgi:integrase